jgi:hypothetical protein
MTTSFLMESTVARTAARDGQRFIYQEWELLELMYDDSCSQAVLSVYRDCFYQDSFEKWKEAQQQQEYILWKHQQQEQ